MSTQPKAERAVLVAVEVTGKDNLWSLGDTLGELAYLAKTAGADVVGEVKQRAPLSLIHI